MYAIFCVCRLPLLFIPSKAHPQRCPSPMTAEAPTLVVPDVGHCQRPSPRTPFALTVCRHQRLSFRLRAAPDAGRRRLSSLDARRPALNSSAPTPFAPDTWSLSTHDAHNARSISSLSPPTPVDLENYFPRRQSHQTLVAREARRSRRPSRPTPFAFHARLPRGLLLAAPVSPRSPVTSDSCSPNPSPLMLFALRGQCLSSP